MLYSEAREQFRLLVAEFFGNTAKVIFNNQSRAVKPTGNLVVIGFGSPKRHTTTNNDTDDNNDIIGNYATQVSVTLDYFSNGSPITEGNNNTVVAYENDSVDKMLALANFLNSDYVIDWCFKNDTSVLMDGEIQDLTGVINDTNYQYRSRAVLKFNFTQRVSGDKADTNV